ncbi:unnamed protein product, partial [Effrenium voratum]
MHCSALARQRRMLSLQDDLSAWLRSVGCQGDVAMENLDPASIETQQAVVSEIFRFAAVQEKDLTLGLLLKAYDVTVEKHGIHATDVVGIQIYRSLL